MPIELNSQDTFFTVLMAAVIIPMLIGYKVEQLKIWKKGNEVFWNGHNEGYNK